MSPDTWAASTSNGLGPRRSRPETRPEAHPGNGAYRGRALMPPKGPAMQRFFAVLALCFFAAPLYSQAQLFRAYLSIKGLDTNPCTLQAPCRLLPAALSAVASGGEIWMLDSANFNTATGSVAKSVSIQAVPGQVASLVAQGSTAAMNISGSGIKVGLRNLVFVSNATSPGTDG